jgi:aryl-phospho-beta-D-glucosidase BglC (GH1 family)
MNGCSVKPWLPTQLVADSNNWKIITKPLSQVSPLITLSRFNNYIQTEKDFALIAGAGLNYVRIPLAFWAIETWDGEPFLAKTSWT